MNALAAKLKHGGLRPHLIARNAARLKGFNRTAIVQRYLAGETAAALADELGVHSQTIRNWASDCGARKRAA